MTGESRTVAWRVSGRVQGVGFRWFVTRRARELGLAGWVENLESGDVTVLAQGNEEQLATLRDTVLQGPPGSRVVEVRDVTPLPSERARTPFSILHRDA